MADKNHIRCALAFCASVALIAASSPLATQSDYPQSQTSRPESERTGDSDRTSDGQQPRNEGESRDDSGSAGGWTLGAVVVGGALLAIFAGGKKGPSGKELLENGPQVPDNYKVGSFPIYGYFKNGWPVVVDFLPTPNSMTWLEVSSREHPNEPLSIVLDPDGTRGRQLITVDLPSEGSAPEARAGKYVVRSARLINGRMARSRAGRQVPAPIEVYGIGGGPRAVGSVAIDALRFSPAQLRPSQTSAVYAYRVRSPFNRASAEIVRFAVDGDKIQIKRVAETTRSNIFSGEHSGNWDGMIAKKRKASIGLHRLQVRGWFTSDDRSWVGAMSPMLVNVAE